MFGVCSLSESTFSSFEPVDTWVTDIWIFELDNVSIWAIEVP